MVVVEAKIIDQFRVERYTALKLDRDVPESLYNTYIIDDIAYDAVPYFARPITGKKVTNIITIQAMGDFIGKTVLLALR